MLFVGVDGTLETQVFCISVLFVLLDELVDDDVVVFEVVKALRGAQRERVTVA